MPAGTGKLVVLAWALSGPIVNAAFAGEMQTPSVERYESALSGYQRFADQPVGDWREANALVGRIGGWRAYARESQRSTPAASPGVDKPAAPPADSAHGAHHR